VALHLAFDLAVVVHDHQEAHQHADAGRQAEHGEELLLSLLAPLGAPGELVDSGHQSKLLRARPQAIINAGASWARAWAWTRAPSCMWASGLAMTVGTPSCSSTRLAMPAIEAQPPASTTWSTRL